MTLPQSSSLPINKLAAAFNNTSATYKFYWFLSILQQVEKGEYQIPKRELFGQMIANAWYTVNYFKVSFGKQDMIQQAVKELVTLESLTIDESLYNIHRKLNSSEVKESVRTLMHFDKQVPHWFLSPWYPKLPHETDSVRMKRIYTESQLFKDQPIYALHYDYVIINPDWISYLSTNARILKDFCYWNLTLFLQTKNPNVPDIANKIIKPAKRNSLTTQRSKFWNIIFDELGSIDCIYTGKRLYKEKYAVEHFIPYSFVSHDLMWNLIPADSSFNSSKSDKLPKLDTYFNPFYSIQKEAIEIIKHKHPNNKLLDDYLTIFPSLDAGSISEDRYKNYMQPLITIAKNNGFEYMI